jgi:alpha-amylase
MKPDKKRIICLFFYVHQPFRLKTYRFFNIGNDHNYYDDPLNRNIIKNAAHYCYLPTNDNIRELIQRYPDEFKVTFGISGTALEQLRKQTPKVIESFNQLYHTGNIEFVAEPYSNSLAMLSHESEYIKQIEKHCKALISYFGSRPTALVNTNLLYSNDIATLAHYLGFTTVLTEGSGQALGWKSPNYLYSSEPYPDIKLLLRNYELSDDIAFRFSRHECIEWPLTSDKLLSRLNSIDPKEQLINLFMDYGAMGDCQNAEAGIFNFMNDFVDKAINSGKWSFKTVSEIAGSIDSVATLNISEAISWADQERDTTAWLGNELQQEAYKSLYSVAQIMETCTDMDLLSDWNKLQTCDHFYYMSTKSFDNRAVRRFYSPYKSPYEAFVNYMNVLSDFIIRANEYELQKARSYKRKQKYQEIFMITL